MINLTHNTQRTIFVIAITFFMVACGKSQESQQPVMPAMPVSVLEMQPTTVPIQTEAVAQTEGAKEVEVRPRVGGILLKKLFAEGEEIKEGQPMFSIDPVPYQTQVSQANAQLAQQKARLVQTQREEVRLKQLLETKSISQREYDNAFSDQAIANASLQQYKALLNEAQLNLSYAKVKAPASGIAGRFLYSEGALVSANTSLLTTIVQTSPIWVRFSLSDSELAQLGGMLTEETVQGIALILPDGTQYAESGKLNFSASSIDPTLGTQQLRAEFKNADKKLIPGQFVRIRVTTGNNDGVFLVPQAAVLTGDQGKFVFVAEQDKEGKTIAAVRPVQAGGWSGQDWVILDGLKQGDKVIVDNLIKVRPGAPVTPNQPAGKAAEVKAETVSNEIN
ncbi:MAG: efflux RND transporter periplasmic adaptor subunit [Betaproteobacteria bacterium]|nr:efflux RND transporter periplasmic adaptor subunit [Betaproteobacteria bacterium]MCH9849557.1 efflux RND transporter periplasmic adaptor subunit [Betaproteobacteria bacterium]